jgi:hypothetical protein
MGGAKFCSGDAYWAAFARVLEDGGNLAILLGKRSHNLCAIDLDRDDLIDSTMPLSFSDHFQTVCRYCCSGLSDRLAGSCGSSKITLSGCRATFPYLIYAR